MKDFEKQNKSPAHQNDQDVRHEDKQQGEALNERALEERREQAQVALHESLMRLHTLGEEETTAPHVQEALLKEVRTLESIEKDIAFLYEEYKKAKEEARMDSLTKLPNRRAFEEALETKIERASKNDSTELYVLYIDIDKFKEVNDILGHHAGDEYLRLIGHYITMELRPDDMVARLGGDEFAVTIFLRNPRETADEPLERGEEAEAIAGRIYRAVLSAKSELWNKFHSSAQKKIPEEDFLRSVASIGGVRFDSEQSADELMKSADRIMYKVKESGVSGVGWNSEHGNGGGDETEGESER